MPSKLWFLLLATVLAIALAFAGPGVLDATDDSTDGQLSDESPAPNDPAATEEPRDGDTSIDIVNTNLPSWVDVNESLTVSVTVANEGETDEMQSVRLQVDDDGDGELETTVAEEDTMVPAGDTSRVTLATRPDRNGQYEYGVSTDSGAEVTWAVDVLRPPTFEITDAVRNVSAVQGETVNLSAQVRNTGDYSGEGTVRFVTATDAQTSDASTERAGTGRDLAAETATLSADELTEVTLTISTDGMEPGVHSYSIETADTTTDGEMRVLEPASFQITDLTTIANVTRDKDATILVTVTNTGEVTDTQELTFEGPLGEVRNRTLTLQSNESKTIAFNVSTDNLTRGTYPYEISTEDDKHSASSDDENESLSPIRVREGEFRFSDLRGTEQVYLGDMMTFAVNVTNVGDAAETQTIEFKLDANDDDSPESHGLTENVTLAPGEETTVRFQIPHSLDTDALDQVETLPIGTYIYGFYMEDARASDVFDVRSSRIPFDENDGTSDSDDSTGDSGDTDDDSEPTLYASLDEISQQKYGYYYDELSAETQSQIAEIHDRQPFADGLGITDVRTREEIARWDYGVDVQPGEKFHMEELDPELQQQIEADYDAQFSSETDDGTDS